MRVLVYGGLGAVASERILRALEKFGVEIGIVDIPSDVHCPYPYYRVGLEPVGEYNAAIVCTPNHTHRDITIKALRLGLHVLCEKPIAHTLGDAREMVEVACQHPYQIAMISEHYTYKPVVRDIIQNWRIYSEQIGKLINITACVLETGGVERREWLMKKSKSGGGMAIDTGIHLITILGKMFGFNKIRVTKSILKRDKEAVMRIGGDCETFARIGLQIHSDPESARRRTSPQAERVGNFDVDIEVGKFMPFVRKNMVFYGENGVIRKDLAPGSDEAYSAILGEFFSAIENKRAPYTTMEDGYKALQIIDTAYKMGDGMEEI